MVPLRVAVLSHAAAPLIFQPDSKYVYSNAGINTAGRIAEVLSGMSFEQFLDARLLNPLGMTDTTFWPSDDQVARLALSYKPKADKSGIEPAPIGQLTYPLQDRARQPMPGGGLFSTARDVARFCQMLLNRGTLAGKRVLSENAVSAMTARQTPPDMKESYGFGLQVHADDYGHGGAHATNMTVNTKHGLVLVFLVQHTGGWRDDSGKKILPAFQEAAINAFGKK
jgi:CubicO group peptidase (beta-lactamase class C family)